VIGTRARPVARALGPTHRAQGTGSAWWVAAV